MTYMDEWTVIIVPIDEIEAYLQELDSEIHDNEYMDYEPENTDYEPENIDDEPEVHSFILSITPVRLSETFDTTSTH